MLTETFAAADPTPGGRSRAAGRHGYGAVTRIANRRRMRRRHGGHGGRAARGFGTAAALSGLLLLAVTATAQAHTGSASATCKSVTLNWTAFAASGTGNGGLNTPAWTIVFTPTGGAPKTLTGTVSFAGSSFSTTIAIPSGDGAVTASSAWTGAQTRDQNSNSFTQALAISNCPAITAIVTTASVGAPVGGAVYDSAVLSGGSSPTGTITFRLYAASDATCATALKTVTTAVTAGNGTYASPSVTPGGAGSYQWVASYGGDANNVAATAACDVAAEQVVIAKLAPAISTTASAGFVLGGQATDTAMLSGGSSPTGTITFSLYSAADATCATALESVATPANGVGTYVSPPITPASAGSYQWVASYGGDGNNTIAIGACNDPNERLTIAPVPLVSPAVVSTAPPAASAPAPGVSAVANEKAVCTASTAVLSGVVTVVRNSLSAHVSALGVKSVTFYLDGRKLGTQTKAKRNGFSITINTKKLSYGAHKVKAKLTMKSTACAHAALSGTFIHAKAAAVAPAFTG